MLQICCPKERFVYFPNEWQDYKQKNPDAKLRQHEIEAILEYEEDYNSEFDYIDDYLHFPSPCEDPSECVSAEYCQGKQSKLDQRSICCKR